MAVLDNRSDVMAGSSTNGDVTPFGRSAILANRSEIDCIRTYVAKPCIENVVNLECTVLCCLDMTMVTVTLLMLPW